MLDSSNFLFSALGIRRSRVSGVMKMLILFNEIIDYNMTELMRNHIERIHPSSSYHFKILGMKCFYSPY
jgi:hypothetical protein